MISARARSRFGCAALATVLACSGAGLAAMGQEKAVDPFGQVRVLVGDWEGTSTGEPGQGTARRTYAFVLHEQFLHEKNVSTYPPQEKNKAGEVHEHWGFISYDRARKLLVMRQLHQEAFVNQYVLNAAASSPSKLVFDSERFENVPEGWRARETVEVKSADEFLETFELAEAGKPLQVYSQNHFRRVKR